MGYAAGTASGRTQNIALDFRRISEKARSRPLPNRSAPGSHRLRFADIDDTRKTRPKIVEENEHRGHKPTIYAACNQPVNKTGYIEKPEPGKNIGQQSVPFEIGKQNPQGGAKDENDLEQHAGGKHGRHVGKRLRL